MDEDIEAIIERLQRKRTALWRTAQAMADEFWDVHMAKRGTPENGRYGLRVRENRAGVSAQWFRIRFYDGKDGKKKPQFKYMKLGESYTYRRHHFKDARDWELEMALRIEKRMDFVRRRSETLATITKMLRAYEKREVAFEEQFGEDLSTGDDDRLE